MWKSVIFGISFEFSDNGLNFKNNLSSFKLEKNEEGPKTKTFKLCIL